MKNYLTREQLLTPRPLPTQDLEIPGLGGTVRIRGLTLHERDALEGALRQRLPNGQVVVDTSDQRAKLLVKCLVDEDGKRLFTDDDVSLLANLSTAEMDEAYSVALQLSGVGALVGEHLEKNS